MIRFYKSIPVVCYIFVFTAVSIQWVETDPRASFRIVITQHSSNVAFAGVQLLDQLSCSTVPAPLLWKPSGTFLVCLFPTSSYIPYVFPSFKQGFQICDQLLCRVPVLWFLDLPAFQPVLIYYHTVAVYLYTVVPVQLMTFFRHPSALHCHLYNSPASYRRRRTGKASPLLLTFSGMVPSKVLLAPLIPDAYRIAFQFQCHSNIHPVLIVQGTGIDVFNYLCKACPLLHVYAPLYSCGTMSFGIFHPFPAILSIKFLAVSNCQVPTC